MKNCLTLDSWLFWQPVSAHEFEGSEAWASNDEDCLRALEEFKREWIGQPLPKLGTEASDGMSIQKWRRTMLWYLFDIKLVAS